MKMFCWCPPQCSKAVIHTRGYQPRHIANGCIQRLPGSADHCVQQALDQHIVSPPMCVSVVQGFASPRVRITVETPLLAHGVPPSDTDSQPSSAGLPPQARRQRPLREVLANGTSPAPGPAASLTGSDQEQEQGPQRLASASGTSRVLNQELVELQDCWVSCSRCHDMLRQE